jgi:hypothetical protein
MPLEEAAAQLKKAEAERVAADAELWKVLVELGVK